MHSMVHLGRMMGDVRDDFDREVEHHLATDYPHEASFKKMQAARTGGSLDLGPSEMEQQQQRQAQALQQQTATQGAAQAQQAQAQQSPANTPPAPTGAAGATQPYPAQRGEPTAGNLPQQGQGQAGAGGGPPAAPGLDQSQGQ
jgi:hypothetical protein